MLVYLLYPIIFKILSIFKSNMSVEEPVPPATVRTEESAKEEFEYNMTCFLKDKLNPEAPDMQARGVSLQEEIVLINQDFGISCIPSLVMHELNIDRLRTITYNWITCSLHDAISFWDDLHLEHSP